jgi:hypothetical protein
VPPAPGRLHPARRDCDFSLPTEARNERVVLHDWLSRKTAQFGKQLAPQEQALIAIGPLPDARAPIGASLNPSSTGEVFGDAKSKSACNDPRSCECLVDLSRKTLRQQRVGVKEEQIFARRYGGAKIHLRRPTPRARKHNRIGRACDIPRTVGAAAIDDDDFVRGATLRCRNRGREEFSLV